MREIIFRGKRLDNNEWVYGNYFHYNNKNYNEGLGCFFIQTKLDKETLIEDFEVIPETVGQYTGLTDKNGNKIFEGDIARLISRNQSTYGVTVNAKFVFENFGFMVYLLDRDFLTLEFPIRDLSKDAKITIIGNVYDNPELTKSEE